MDFWFGVFVGFLASVIGSLIMWVFVGNWIVQRRIEKEIKAFMTGKYDDVLEAAITKALRMVSQEEAAAKFIKNYLNGIALAFVNIVCNRFGISQDELKSMVKNAGVAMDEAGNIDFLAMIQHKIVQKAPELIDAGIDYFMGKE